MKKILVISCVLLSGISCSFAQTTPTVTKPATEKTLTQNTPSSLDSITKNIDRRLALFTRYKQVDNMDSIKGLVSEQNKDFYTNFIQFIEKAPVFSVRRDAAQKVIKTPLNEYTFPAIMTVEKKDIKITMTFSEEKIGQSEKFVIVDSNLHLQKMPTTVAKTTTKSPSSLASNALNTTKTPTTPSTPITTTTPAKITPTTPSTPAKNIENKGPGNIPASANSSPVVPPVVGPTAPATSLWNKNTQLGTGIGLIVILFFGTLFFVYCRKNRKKSQNITSAPSAPIPTKNTPLPTTPPTQPVTQVLSNVPVTQASSQETSKEPIKFSPEIPTIQTTTIPPSTPTVHPIETIVSNVTVVQQQNPIAPRLPLVEKTEGSTPSLLSDISDKNITGENATPLSVEPVKVISETIGKENRMEKLDDSVIYTPKVPATPHPLFESILNQEEPKKA